MSRDPGVVATQRDASGAILSRHPRVHLKALQDLPVETVKHVASSHPAQKREFRLFDAEFWTIIAVFPRSKPPS